MMIELDILQGVGVPVFVISAARPRSVLAWNQRMAELIGIPGDQAIGQGVEQVFGPAGAVLQGVNSDGLDELPGIGAIVARFQNGRIVVTLSEAPNARALGLAVEDLRGPLRRIHQLAGDAQQDVFAAEASLVRIRQIAREGLGKVPVPERKSLPVRVPRPFALRGLCEALVQDVAPGLICDVAGADVLAEPRSLKAGLRALFTYAMESGMSAVTIAGEYDGEGVAFRISFEGADARLTPSEPGFREDRWIGLLTLRRNILANGGQLRIAKGSQGTAPSFIMTVPRSMAPEPTRYETGYLPAAE